MEIASQLNLPYNEIQLNRVLRAGGGSSFQRQKFNGKAQEMKVNDRWKKFVFSKNKEVREFVLFLLKNNAYHLIGSNAHNAEDYRNFSNILERDQ